MLFAKVSMKNYKSFKEVNSMFKKFMKLAVIGAAVFGFAGAASAATNYQINLYGASAQYYFWNDAADNFLSAKGCTPTQGQDSAKKNGITYATCTNGDTYTIRYSSKASYDGILAVKGDNSMTGAAEKCNDGDAVCAPTNGVVPSGKAGYYRKMSSTVGAPGTYCCAKITVGASDVSGEAFTQESHGNLLGYAGGASTNRSFDGIDAAGLSYANPLVVPFGFFANNCVTKTRCATPEPASTSPFMAIPTWYNECYDYNDGYKCVNGTCDSGPKHGNACNDIRDCGVADGKSKDCIGYFACTKGSGESIFTCKGGTRNGQSCDKTNGFSQTATDCPNVALADTKCKRFPIDNVSRSMVTLIFNDQAQSWKDFGDWYEVLNTTECNAINNFGSGDPTITKCLRHAGSGTHATLDLAVMSGKGWGWPLATTQYSGGNVWFNDGSGDEINCVNNRAGAIGYSDCDALAGGSGIANVHEVKYQGVECRRAKIRNCEYDFWSVQWLYWDDATVAEQGATDLVGELVSFASDANNLPEGKKNYWAAVGEMKCTKSGDSEYPGFNGGGTELP
jgi:hypothetical protein